MKYETPSIRRYGLPALFEELEAQGVKTEVLLQAASVSPYADSLNSRERLAVLREAAALCRIGETALLAGARQRISNFGVYGYALASSATMLDVFKVFASFFDLSGSLFRVTGHVENGVGVLRSHHPESLGRVLPFVAEFWRSSQTKLLSTILGRPFPSLHMYFPYPAPKHAHLYEQFLNCPVTFGSEKMEWHYDAAVHSERCPNADLDTARLCSAYCEQFIEECDGQSELQLDILRQCLPDLTEGTNAKAVAGALNMSLRTFHRRLNAEGINFQLLLDRLRRSVAIEYLENTKLPMEEIGSRCGYQDVSNFRKAFKRWTGCAPSTFR